MNSARFAGKHGDDEANNRRLLELMEQVDRRDARFVSVLALASPFGPTRTFTGTARA